MIFLLAGHTSKGLNQDPGAIGNGYREADLTMELRDMVADILRARGLKVHEDDDTHRLATVLSLIKSKEHDIVVDIHFDSFDVKSTGVTVVIPDRNTEDERAMGASIASKFGSIMRIKNRGVVPESKTARKTLAVMRPAGINILVETCFISNPNDISAYQANKQKLAIALADTIEIYERKYEMAA